MLIEFNRSISIFFILCKNRNYPSSRICGFVHINRFSACRYTIVPSKNKKLCHKFFILAQSCGFLLGRIIRRKP